jgi:DNA-binding response OmpR family regulator
MLAKHVDVRPKRILIVDATRTVCTYLKNILNNNYYEFDEVRNGIQALVKCIGMSPPDLVLMYVDISKMSDIDCCRRIKEQSFRVPVIIVSTLSGDDLLDMVRDSGCDGFFSKPINTNELQLKVRSLIGV